jgi:hypothetical protein
VADHESLRRGPRTFSGPCHVILLDMAILRRCLVGLIVLTSTSVGCGWQGPAAIEFKDGTMKRCPNVLTTDAYVSCDGFEGGSASHIYPIDTVARVVPPPT